MSQLTDRIDAVQDVLHHYAATYYRVQSIASGAPLPEIAHTSDARLFEFGHNTATAAYFAQGDADLIKQVYTQIESVALPSQSEFNALASQAQETYSGSRRIFSKFTPEAKQAQQDLDDIDIASAEKTLDQIDSALHTNKFGEFSFEIDTQAALDEVEKKTGDKAQSVDTGTLETHCKANAQYYSNQETQESLDNEVRRTAQSIQLEQAQPLLASKDISVLNSITTTALRLGPLEGMTIAQLADSDVSDLTGIEGLGDTTARKAIAAARSYRTELIDSQKPHIDYEIKSPQEYVVALANLITYKDQLRDLETPTFPMTSFEQDSLYVTTGPVTWVSEIPALSAPSVTPEHTWEMYAQRAAEFNSYRSSSYSSEGSVPEEVAERIAQTTLEGTLHATLRGYQDFGAKFALVQRRTLIGDDMGLGKTMQALALMAHVGGRALVVCPASLRLNWERELTKFTDLPVYVLHGSHKDELYTQWQEKGGVAIAGFAAVRNNPQFTAPAHPLDVFVVDEAHRAKNQDSLQAQGVKDIAAIADYVLFLTGTPLENKVSEFSTLISYLDPTLDLGDQDNNPNPQKFKEAISGIYLRRNQSDVLDELPPLVEVEEWVEPTKEDTEEYKKAVKAGHFMNMRRANFGLESAKMERLIELTEDGSGKTIVFTFFTSVVNDVLAALGDRAYGPISGKVSHANRQKEVDRFTEAPEGAVLVCQIKAASEGLNIQAANRVILCEPQLNPQTEAQAIARAYRMGQVNTVEVHRLLTPNSIDERLMGILDSKRVLFEDFAREAESTVNIPEAYDTTDKAMIEQLIAQEREKYDLPTDTTSSDTDPESSDVE